MKSLARGSTEARNKFALCAVGTPENLGQSLHSSTDDPSHKATTMLPPTAPEHLLLLGHLFRLLVPLPLRGDFSSSLQPCRACPPASSGYSRREPAPSGPRRPTCAPLFPVLAPFPRGLSASVLFVSLLLSPTQSLSRTPLPTTCKPHNSKNFV